MWVFTRPFILLGGSVACSFMLYLLAKMKQEKKTYANGYGMCVWYIPMKKQMKHIQETYEMTHIPHVTVATNLTFAEALRECFTIPQMISFEMTEPLAVFPSMYKNDMFTAIGFYGILKHIDTEEPFNLEWQPHMSIRYCTSPKDAEKYLHKIEGKHLRIMSTMKYIRCIVDARSPYPEEWRIVYQDLQV